ncbi:MAG: hypothetical protein K2J77_02860 [Oscillospiraceae bacterium]|nr:hypothetical protein [Oscillospiraceae bacterium]
MNVKPIPKALLGESLVLILPTTTGTLETPISNVRVERTQSVSGLSTRTPKNSAEITVWADHKNSTWAEFPVGAKVKYGGETFEIIEQKLYKDSSGAPHHVKFTARIIGENGDEAV